MICTKCFHGKTDVINSRPLKKAPSIWRRRKCQACGHIFTTTETPDLGASLTIDSEPFSAPRLTVHLANLLGHRGTDAADEATWLVNTIVQDLWKTERTAFTKKELLHAVHPVLDRFDAIAGLRFAAEHGLIHGQQQKPRRGRPRITRL